MATNRWFGNTEFPRFPFPSSHVRAVMRREVADTGLPPCEILPAVPFVIPRSSYVELFRAGVILLGLLKRAVLQSGDTTDARLAAYGMTEDHPLFLPDPYLEENYAACLARPDVVIGPNGPQFLEFNPSGAVSGPVELHCMLRAWNFLHQRYELPPFRSDDPLLARSLLFRDVCDELDLPSRVALVGSIRDLKHTEASRFFDLELEVLHRQGFVADFFEPEQLVEALGSGPHPRYPLGLRNFTTVEWAELGIDITPICDAVKQECLLLPTETASFLDNKKTMGLISEGLPWMTAAERNFVDKYLPWTRILGDRRTTRRGDVVNLPEYVLSHQQDLVLKRGIGMQGKEVVLGHEVSAARWHEQVQDAVSLADSVVQDYVQPECCGIQVSYNDDDEPQREVVTPVLSPFLFGGRRGGVWARFFVKQSGGVVSREGHGALENAVVAVD